jgi:hypothetical protein
MVKLEVGSVTPELLAVSTVTLLEFPYLEPSAITRTIEYVVAGSQKYSLLPSKAATLLMP